MRNSADGKERQDIMGSNCLKGIWVK